MNSVVLIGRLTRDPELRFIPTTGMAVSSFTLAVDKDLFGDKRQEAISQGKPTADFIYVTVFGKQAENCANFMHKETNVVYKEGLLQIILWIEMEKSNIKQE